VEPDVRMTLEVQLTERPEGADVARVTVPTKPKRLVNVTDPTAEEPALNETGEADME